VGQGITGHPPEDGIMPVLQGPGSNGKTLLSTDGLLPALGDYSSAASHKLITSQKAGSSEHSTEMADLQGKRLLIGEELSEGRSIDVTALKRIMDVSQIRARFVHKDNISFTASHSLFCTTNYRPVINETDHGTWRRLALLVFRYTFRKPEEELARDTDRHGDPELKTRIRRGWDGQHDAVVTWAVQGAMRWYGRGMTALPPTERITEDTRAWRASADHVMSFWDEFLVKDAGDGASHPPCISASHLHAVFNAWLMKNGHSAWTKQTFAARFGEHGETTSKGVRYELTRRLANLSWYRGTDLQVPAETIAQQMRAWVGVRFRLPVDNAPTWESDERDGSFGNFSRSPLTREFPIHPSPTSQPPATSENVPGATLNDSPVTQPPPPWKNDALTPPLEPPRSAQGTVVFDLETGSADDLFTYTQSDETGFVRLAGALGPDRVPRIMSARELIPLLESAQVITGHNIFGFDLLALAYHHGADWDQLAAKALDTELVARQADPPRSRESGSSADRYGLDEVAARLGVTGKTDDLARLARQHKGYDRIPLDDPEYRSYLEGDLHASAAVSAVMAATYPPDAYLVREHRLAALAGRMTLNGFLVDQELLAQRLAEGQARKREALELLRDGWGLPLTKTVLRGRGKNRAEAEEEVTSPLATDAGRAWLDSVWQRYGIESPPRTGKTGKLSTGADDLAAVVRDSRCPDQLKQVIKLIGIVVGTRTVYATAADCLAPDGRVHPGNSFRQASGRWSVTNPGLTVFGKRGGRHHERDIFLPDPGHVLLSFDLSQVDMRSMAGHSQDPNYMALFAPGRDAHQEIADQVGLDRQSAKQIGHGWNYGLGPKRMVDGGLDPQKVATFIAGMEERFPVLIAWREMIREQGKAGEILNNGFGRRMRCDESRAYTVAPALMGQGGARDIMCESLLRLPREIWPMLRTMVHDEILLSVPKDIVRDVIPIVRAAMTWEWRGVPITCDMSFGATWGECSAK
jgi:P4 family phage/plasmid primase-like protien